jgi:hypothetical protein
MYVVNTQLSVAKKRNVAPFLLASRTNRVIEKVLQMSLHDITTSQSVLNPPAADT